MKSNEIHTGMSHLARLLLFAIAITASTLAQAQTTGLEKGTPQMLSQSGVAGIDGGAAAKAKLMQLEKEVAPGSGTYTQTLISLYGDSPNESRKLWDWNGYDYPSRDIYARRSTDNGETWSDPLNISNMAVLTSISADHDGDPDTADQPYYGGCDKPQVFGSTQTGDSAVVLWSSAYIPGAMNQGTVVYPESNGVEVPFQAIYFSRTIDGGLSWSAPELLSSGFRDAKQYSVKGTGQGFVMAWQEDPHGLQPGDAEGPGDGGSGAKTSKGTDIWYTAISRSNLEAGMPVPAAARVTNNYTQLDRDNLESGPERASRPQIWLIGTTALLAYEETKALEKFDEGKYIRYHLFPSYTDFTASGLTNSEGEPFALASDATQGKGWIISNPEENARRVRVLIQGTPGSSTGLRLIFIWRQGNYAQGGPADIMARVGHKSSEMGSDGLRPQDLYPAVNAGASVTVDCSERGDPDLLTGAFGNTAAMNLSTTAASGLAAASDEDNLESARAHRGVMSGDYMAIGYTHTPNGPLAQCTDQANYNFYVRQSTDGGMTWTEPYNLSQIADTTISVREPRMVKAPSTADSANPTNGQVLLCAWGTERNQYDSISEGIIDLDIYYTRSLNRGMSYEPTQVLSVADGATTNQFESQIVSNPAGTEAFAVWMSVDANGSASARFNHLSEGDIGEALVFTDATSSTRSVLTLDEGDAVELLFPVEGGSGSSRHYRAQGLPTWLTLNANTGRISGTAPDDALGVYKVSLVVEDDTFSSTRDITLIVYPNDEAEVSRKGNSSCAITGTDSSSVWFALLGLMLASGLMLKPRKSVGV